MSNLVLNAGWLGDWFYGIWINLMLLIDNVIYVFINWMYRIFMLVAKVDIFGGGAEIEAITRRIYVIVGIAMLFIFAYNLILLIINPEGKQLGNMAKVVQRAIISIILVTLLPLLFSYLTTIQNHVLESNVIGQIILGTSSDADIQTTNKKAGVKAALDIFSAFYHPKGQTYNTCKSNSGAHELCDEYVSAFDTAYQNDDISTFIWDDDLKDGAKEDKMEYNWIISTAAGVFALWMFVSFALDIGVRVGKMAFYELISPIPVMMRILPNDKMFDKWFKGITSTFISLFVRLAVIYFCMYAITLVPEILTNMWASNGDNLVLLALANVVVILGILKFAQEAPKLISDLFGGSGDLKFGITSKVKDNKLAMGAMGAIGAGFGGMTGNAWNSWKTMGKGKGFKHNAGALFGGVTSGIGGLAGGVRRGATSGYKATTFEGLGDGITQSKQDTYTARDRRDENQAKNRAAGTIKGKEVPVISGALGGIKRHTGDAWKTSVKWMAGEDEGASPRAQAYDRSKAANAPLRSDTYTAGKGYTSKEQLQEWINALRQGGHIQFGDSWYGGSKDVKKIQSAIESLTSAVKSQNREVQIKNYKDKSYVFEGHLAQLRKEINRDRGLYSESVENLLASKLEAAAKKATPEVKTILDNLVVGGKVQMDNIDKMLNMNKSQIESSTDAQRMAIAIFSDEFNTVMGQASTRNAIDKKDKK